jgi:hypothetical protein
VDLRLTGAAVSRGSADALAERIVDLVQRAGADADAELAALTPRSMICGADPAEAGRPRPGAVLRGLWPRDWPVEERWAAAVAAVMNVEGTARSPEGDVRAVVGSTGALMRLRLTPAALAAGADRLAAVIRSTVAEACADATGQVVRQMPRAGQGARIDLAAVLPERAVPPDGRGNQAGRNRS